MDNKQYQKEYRKKHLTKALSYNLKYKKVNKDKLKIARIPYREVNREKIKQQVWVRKLRNRYGLSPEQFFKMVESQMEKCAICGANKKLTVDHDHISGKVRGLLCGDCNRGLGLFRDNSQTLLNAINYLKNNE